MNHLHQETAPKQQWPLSQRAWGLIDGITWAMSGLNSKTLRFSLSGEKG